MDFVDRRQSGSLAAQEDAVIINSPGTGTVVAQLSGTFSATVTFEATLETGASPTWVAVPAANVNSGAVATTATAAGLFRINASGLHRVRARCSAFVSGPVNVVLQASMGDSGGASGGTSSGGTVDTELPAAATLTDDLANPTTTNIAALSYGWDGSNWDRTITFPGATDTRSASTLTGLCVQAFNYFFDGTNWARGRCNSAFEQRTVSGGYTTIISTTLTRPGNTTAYTAGDEVTDTGGAIQTLTGIARASGGSGVIQGVSCSISSNWATKPSLDLFIYDTTSTPQTDNAAFAPSDGVQDTCIGVISLNATYIGDATGSTGNFVMDSGQVSLPFLTSGSANLFLRVVIRNAGQAGANSDTLKFRFRVFQD